MKSAYAAWSADEGTPNDRTRALGDGRARAPELLKRAGDRSAAADAYQKAIAPNTNSVQRAEVERRMTTL